MTSSAAPLPASLLETLGRYDTPTICNAMEVVAPDRRLIGYTTKPLVSPFPDLPPIVGYARTVSIRSVIKSGLRSRGFTCRCAASASTHARGWQSSRPPRSTRTG